MTGSSETEELVVAVRLVSSKKTQIRELHELVNSKRHGDAAALTAVFEKLMKCKWGDLVKLLREMLDALIGLLRDRTNKARGLSVCLWASRACCEAAAMLNSPPPPKRTAPQIPQRVFFFFAHIMNEIARPHNRGAGGLFAEFVAKQDAKVFGDLHAIIVDHIRKHLTCVVQQQAHCGLGGVAF
jgi:hypothetical protein